jgi:fatty acid desaturase
MSNSAAVARPEARAKPGGLNAEIKALSARDNWTNWYYVGRVWVIVAVTVAGCVWAQGAISEAGLNWAWHVPVFLFGLVVIGASQHQLGGVLHEGTHFMLFANRKLNDIAADVLAGFPMYTSIYHYRLYHLAHHQFINDPLRDPDLVQLRISGHSLDFPVTHIEILLKILKQLWLPNLFRYTIGRVRSHSFDASHNPYADPSREGSKWPLLVSVFFWVGVPVLMVRLLVAGYPMPAMVFLAAMWAATVIYYAVIPASAFPGSRLEPVISHRATAIARASFLALLYFVLTAIDFHRGTVGAWRAWEIYWLVPLFTTFPLFMILRHWVHHGNADRGRFTNTRVYLVNPFVCYALFPFGFEYHLPHHIYASVPHFRLKKLHELLQNDPEYKEKAVIVEGYFGHGNPETGRPTAMAVLGETYAPKGTERAYLDSSVLDRADVSDRAGIEREVEHSAGAASA